MPRTTAPAAPVAPSPLPENPFAAITEAPAPPPVNTQDLVARLTALQKNVQQADIERAQAETLLESAQKDLKGIDDGLRALKVDPDQAAEALAKLEIELATLTQQHEEQIQEERAAYAAIVAASK